MSTDMLSCPFCAGDSYAHQGHADITYFLCDHCGAVSSFRPDLKGAAAFEAYNRRDELTNRLAALPKQGWMGIETAPKGQRILTWCASDTEYTYKMNINYCKNNTWMKSAPACQPTHWQPLPPPPEVQKP